jgi:hypothetical protein
MSPRRHRAGRDRPGPPLPRPSPSTAPVWALVSGVEVRSVSGDKPYRCPGCNGTILPGTAHLVVVPTEAPEDRRHWHTPCWRRELNRRG